MTRSPTRSPKCFAALLLAPLPGPALHATEADDKAAVALLDTRYQAAVKANDAETMDRILADDFVLGSAMAPPRTRPTC